MKKWIFALLFLFPISHCHREGLAQERKLQVIGAPFGTLNNTDSAFAIKQNQAQNLLNVDLSPGGKSVKKRKGYGLAYTLTIDTSPVHGMHSFYNADGNQVSLFFNDTYAEASIDGQDPVVLFSTGPNGATYQCVDSLGEAYCANTDNTPVIQTDGDTYSLITTHVSTPTMLTITPSRLVMAGFTDAPSRVDFSAEADFTNTTAGGDPTDPINFTINSAGSEVKHIVYAHGRVYVFKDASFVYIMEGPTHSDWIVRIVSPDIGTLQNTSILRDDILRFQGQDGHFYAFDGSSLVKESRDIQTTVNLSQSGSGSWEQTTTADWNAGVFDNNVYVDTVTTSGRILTTFPDDFTSYRDGSGSTKLVWDEMSVTPSTAVSAVIHNGATKLKILVDTEAGAGGPAYGGVRTAYPLQDFSDGVTYYFQNIGHETNVAVGSGISDFELSHTIALSTTSNITTRLGLSQVPRILIPIVHNPQNGNKRWYLGDVACYEADGSTQTLCSSPCNSASATANDPNHYFDATIFISDDYLSISVSGVTASPITLTSTHSCGAFQPTVYQEFSSVLGGDPWRFSNGLSATYMDRFTVVPQTFTFSSQVHNAPNLSAWNTLDITKVDGGGSHTFSMRSSTNSFTISSSTPSWTTVTAGNVPTISTGSYFQVRDYFNYTSTNAAMLMDDFTVNWTEGAAPGPSFGIYHEDALWWASAVGSGQSTNNRVVKYDLINSGWLLYDIPINGMLIRNNTLYFGSASEGKIYTFGSVDSDAGEDIEAYWKSRDFFGDSPFLDKDLWNIGFISKTRSGAEVDVTYEINGTTSTTITVPIYESDSTNIVKRNINLPLGTVANTFNVKFGNDASDQPFEIFVGQIEYSERRWMPEDGQ